MVSHQSLGIILDDENYYLVGYDTDAGMIKHYRVDKMLHIKISDESREGKEHFKKLIWRIMQRRVLECLEEKSRP